MKTLGEQIRMWRDQLGISQAAVAEAMGVKQQAIGALEKGKTRHPWFINQLIAFFAERLPDEPIYEKANQYTTVLPSVSAIQNTLAKSRSAGIALKVEDAAQPHTPVTTSDENARGIRDLPIFASCEGGEGEVLLTYDPIEWRERPSPLKNVRNAYGMYVVNDSMSPAFRQGDILQVHPNKPPIRGRHVIVVLKDGTDEQTGERRCLVKEFVSRDRDCVKLRQYNPDRTFDVPAEQVESVHLVVGVEFA